MSIRSLSDAWIKAAVEHVTLEITYFSGRTKQQSTLREVEPDYLGPSVDGKNTGCWGYCRLRKDNRVFYPDSVASWSYIGNLFAPNPQGRWTELIPLYNARGLKNKTW